MELLTFVLWMTAAVVLKVIIIFLSAVISGAGLYLGINLFQVLKAKWQAKRIKPETKEKLHDIWEQYTTVAGVAATQEDQG